MKDIIMNFQSFTQNVILDGFLTSYLASSTSWNHMKALFDVINGEQ